MKTRSLRKRLTWMLGLAVLAVGLTASIVTFFQSFNEARELQDDTLHQIAFLLSQQTTGASGSLPQQQAGRLTLQDSDARVGVLHLPGDVPPAWFNDNLPAGFSTVHAEEGPLRVFRMSQPSGDSVLVTQPADIRDDIAHDSALRVFIPLFIFLPVMAWLILRIVKTELRPISTLAGYVDAHQNTLPSALPVQQLPEEILPFIQAINRLLQRVNTLMSQQQRFVADAAHELRSPLAALMLQAQNLEQAKSLESLQERITLLQRGLERTRKLTEQLLSFARLQAQPAQIAPVDVSAMARQLIADYLTMAEDHNIDLGLEEEAQLQLEGNEGSYRLMLKNAVENALQYTPAGGQVTIRLFAKGKNAGFEVMDTGPGIPLEEQKRVLDPFYRLPGSPGGGSGLGLAIAAEAASYEGGTLQLINRADGRGLIFHYEQRLPQ